MGVSISHGTQAPIHRGAPGLIPATASGRPAKRRPHPRQCQNARAGNVWIEFDRSAALAHHKIGETHRTAVKRTCRVDEFAVVAGPFRHWYIAGVEGHE